MATLLVCAGAFSVRRAVADFEFRRGTPESVARAVETAPSNAEYLLFRALQIEYDGGDSTATLERAAAVDPYSSAPRIRLGLAAEVRGDQADAERWLLDAAKIDRQFEPGWTLANFYFRHDRMAEFWKWMKTALEVSYGDRRPAFDLCWRASSDAEEIARAISERHEVLGAYLAYLLETHRVDAAGPVSLKFAASRVAGDQALLLGACDEFIRAGKTDAALALWDAVFPKYTGLVRGNFDAPAIGQGFDWRADTIPGVVHLDLDMPARHRITLTGRQPESCVLLRQTVVVEPGREYRLRWESRGDVKSGVEFRVAGAKAALSAGELAFRGLSRMVELTVNYDRPQGEVRAEGSVELWGVKLEVVK